MTSSSTRRSCPYCGHAIELEDCQIVATNFKDHVAPNVPLEQIKLPSGAAALAVLEKTKWPVVARAPRKRGAETSKLGQKRSRTEGYLVPASTPTDRRAGLPPLLSGGVSSEDLPARACPDCEFPLPQSIDTREAMVIAVIGVNRVGKTHLLAASLTEAHRRNGLAALDCQEFEPADTTNQRFREDYYTPLFREGRLIEPTPATVGARFEPLVFNVTLPGAVPFSVVMHDLAGETLSDYGLRAHEAAYLRAARGIIFVIDPRDIDDLREGLPSSIIEGDDLGGWDQGALLSSCTAHDGLLSDRLVPLAITVTKADLLPLACSEELPFLESQPPSETYNAFLTRVAARSREVREFLERHRAHNVVRPAREYELRLRGARAESSAAKEAWRVGRVTYHAVSALGSQPDGEQLSDKVRPLNCLDPLGIILAQLAGRAPDET